MNCNNESFVGKWQPYLQIGFSYGSSIYVLAPLNGKLVPFLFPFLDYLIKVIMFCEAHWASLNKISFMPTQKFVSFVAY